MIHLLYKIVKKINLNLVYIIVINCFCVMVFGFIKKIKYSIRVSVLICLKLIYLVNMLGIKISIKRFFPALGQIPFVFLPSI